MPQLDFTTYSSQIFWLIVSFIFLFGFTSGYFLPKFYNLMSNRKIALDGDSLKIDKIKKDIQDLVNQRNKQINDVHEQVEYMIKNSVDRINNINDEYENKIDIKAESTKRNLKESLNKQKIEILQSLEVSIEKIVNELLLKIENQGKPSEPANKKKSLVQKPKRQKKIVNKSL